jgi:hypothetical protein
LTLCIGVIASDAYFPVLTHSAPKSESCIIWFDVSFLWSHNWPSRGAYCSFHPFIREFNLLSSGEYATLSFTVLHSH